jgi:hypothetical protein
MNRKLTQFGICLFIVGVFYAMVMACVCPPSTPCYDVWGTWPNCYYHNFDKCGTGNACCGGNKCYNLSTQFCCKKSINYTYNYQVCDKNNEVCCGSSNCCKPADCETCVNGQCKVCGGDTTKQCCNGGSCCNKSCSNSWSCEKCKDGGGCQPCLRKAANYGELSSCSKVDDPATQPTANGCSAPLLENGNNPAGCTYSSFLNSCNSHDLCYGNCSQTQSACDTTFNLSMEAVCTSEDNVADGCYYPCNSWKNVYHMAVLGAGVLYYKPAQVAECACNDC